MSINKSNRIFGLDLMRAVAIILVLISHSIWVIPITNPRINELVALSGYLGVEIFFVLSGFLIGKILFRIYISVDFKIKDFGHFLVRRWFRTLPNYYLILLVNILIAICLGTKLPNDLWQYFVFFQNLAWPMSSFFGESWSLSIEEFAYILGPLVLYLTFILNRNTAKSKLFLGVTVFIIVGFTLARLFYNSFNEVSNMTIWNRSLKAVVIYRVDAIYYGVLAAYISVQYPKFWMNCKFYGLVIGVFSIVGLNIFIPQLSLFIEISPLFWNIFYVAINSIAIACLLPYLSNVKSVSYLISKPVTFISIISYAIYLTHFSLVVKFIQQLKVSGPFANSNLILLTLYIGLTILLSYLLFRFYEKPITNLRDRIEIKNYFK
ncbi:acyltransferase family protein [Winogradskyella sp. PE311]|uniref:acyltransferase family protein n=1 Tax=Winogradskyella sp. PE311 TaxID=3366943 RepID=UPI0039812457